MVKSTIYIYLAPPPIENLGKKNATNLRIDIPKGSGINVISSVPEFLSSQSSVDLTFLTRVSKNESLGEKYGQILITCTESSYLYISYRIYITSTSTLNLTVIVEDEFTFFAEGNPLVQDSTITMRNRIVDFYNKSQITNGSIIVENIYEGCMKYMLTAQAITHTEKSFSYKMKARKAFFMFS